MEAGRWKLETILLSTKTYSCFLSIPSLTSFAASFPPPTPTLSSLSPSQWLKNLYTADDVKDQIYKLAKKGLTPSKIGVRLRDSKGIAAVSSLTGSKILRTS